LAHDNGELYGHFYYFRLRERHRGGFQHLLAFDNRSWLSEEMSDALCRLATGSGMVLATMRGCSYLSQDAFRPINRPKPA
jgi:hypothetical protein